MNAPDAHMWQPLDVTPIPTLADLRTEVLKRSEKRFPKWKFRLMRDLVIQVQPRPGPRCLFECIAVMRDGANAAALSSNKFLDREWWLMRCEICVVETMWQLKPKSFRRGRGAERAGYQHLRARTFAAFDGDDNRFSELTPGLMLCPHCLICGRGLTDPASMARFIGPECAGTSSPTMSGLLSLDEVEPEAWDAGAIATILPDLAKHEIDWSKPLAEWSRETMIGFLGAALDLMRVEMTARDRGGGITRSSGAAEIARQVNGAAGGPLMTPDELNDEIPL